MGDEPEPPPPVRRREQPPVRVREQAPFVPGGGSVADFLWSRSAHGHQSVSVQDKSEEVMQLAARQLDQILNTVPPGERELVKTAMAHVCVATQSRAIGRPTEQWVLQCLGTHCDEEIVKVERARAARS